MRAKCPRTCQSFNVFVKETVIIPKCSEFLLTVFVPDILHDNNLNYLFSPSKEKLAEKNILAACSLSKIKNKKTVIQIFNTSENPVKLFKNYLLGSMELIEPEYRSEIVTSEPFRRTMMEDHSHISNIIDEIKKNVNLSPDQKSKSMGLIQKYSDIFSKSATDIGLCKTLKHEIKLKEGAEPLCFPIRRIPIALEEKVNDLVDDLHEKGIIRESKSPWCAPLVIVKKKNGDIRLCLDFRGLNSLTNRPIYPIPEAQELFDTLSGSHFFSTLDLSNGYYNVEIDEKDKEKTAFATKRGHFEFNRLPFGLCGAPATFQKIMNMILNKENYSRCLVYLDDVLIFSKSFDKHLEDIEVIFGKIRESGVKLSPKKCFFFKNEVKYLGHIISSEGLKTDPDKIKALENWEFPTTLKQLQQFLGFCNYYRKFINKYSEIVKPLENLLKSKSNQIAFSEAEEAAFELIKKKLTGSPILSYPIKGNTFILDTDASHFGMGAVLSQIQNNKEHVIAYASKRFSNSELKYCVTRKELLSVYTFIKQFKHYLLGNRFILRTDHKALLWLLNWKKPNTTQFCNWISELEIYDFEIQHRAGEKHSNADFMSRLEECGQCELLHQDPKPKRNVKLLEYKEEKCRKLSSSEFKKNFIPKSEIEEIILYYHKCFGHVNSSHTENIMKRYHVWPNMSSDIAEVIGRCEVCNERKIGRNLNNNKKSFHADEAFKNVCIDIMGPVESVKGYKYILGIIDVFSRFIKLIPLKRITSKVVAEQIIKNWISIFGIPEQLHSDSGPQFKSEVFNEICKYFQIKQTHSMPYYHKGNGIIERAFKTVEDMVYCLTKDRKEDWVTILPLVEMGFRNTPKNGVTPNEAIFGRNVNVFPYLMYNRTSDGKYNESNLEYLLKLRKNLEYVKVKVLDANDRNFGKLPSHNVKVGQKVMVKLEGKCGINKPRFSGPGEVVKILPHDNLQIKVGEKLVERNINQLKRYQGGNTINQKLKCETSKNQNVNYKTKLRKHINPVERFYNLKTV